MPQTPTIFLTFPTALITMAKKLLVLALNISLRCCTPFKARKLGAFLTHGRQYRRMGLVYCVTSSRDFMPQWRRTNKIAKSIHFFHSSHSLRAMIVKKRVLCANLSHFLHPKLNQAFCKKKKALSLSFYTCFELEWNNEMTSQSKLDPFSCTVVHGPRKRPTSLLWIGTTSEGKNTRATNVFAKVTRAVAKVYFCGKHFGRLWHLKLSSIKLTVTPWQWFSQINQTWYHFSKDPREPISKDAAPEMKKKTKTPM